ncbi:uncharacterized protein K02A2.6-like [Panicum virgatum]|uniref:uncharacterized protein K02A2.6-like n=1 Tax=Panicum virgatum TaxID=38727 RepID=UPI0019D6A23F|nr:uncharacterized protein K02A2.6-like [Panicum virgatum]
MVDGDLYRHGTDGVLLRCITREEGGKLLADIHEVRGYEWLYVAIDKFTKWPEVTAVIKANKNSVLKFIKDLVAQVGVTNRIITDNGTQFMSNLFGDYCDDMGIKLCFASVTHPRSNGQAEQVNTEVLKGLKTRTYNELKKNGTGWMEELPAVV